MISVNVFFADVARDLVYVLHFATVLSRWAPEFTKEVGALEGTLFSHIRKQSEKYLQKR